MSPPAVPSDRDASSSVGRFFGVFRYSKEALDLVWTTDRRLTLILAALTVFAGVIPGPIAFVGKLIVDAVIPAVESGLASDRWVVLKWIGVEAVLIILLAAAQRGLMVAQSLLRALLGQRVNVMILEKAQELDLPARGRTMLRSEHLVVEEMTMRYLLTPELKTTWIL